MCTVFGGRVNQPFTGRPVSRSSETTQSRMFARSCSLVMPTCGIHRYPCPTTSQPRATTASTTAGLRSMASAAAKTVGTTS